MPLLKELQGSTSGRKRLKKSAVNRGGSAAGTSLSWGREGEDTMDASEVLVNNGVHFLRSCEDLLRSFDNSLSVGLDRALLELVSPP
jgi:hypothetical protein